MPFVGSEGTTAGGVTLDHGRGLRSAPSVLQHDPLWYVGPLAHKSVSRPTPGCYVRWSSDPRQSQLLSARFSW